MGRFIAKIIAKKSGGQMCSRFLREYTKEVYKVDIGLYTYGSCFNSGFNSGGSVSIGRYCSFANNVKYIGFNYPVSYISTSPLFFENYYTNKYGYFIDDQSKYQKLKVENDVWIGMNVTILSGCHRIGNGAIIGAGSVVTKDVPDYAIVCGNPAKVIKYRFESCMIKNLLSTKWWENEPERVMKYYKYIDCPDKFIANFKLRE